MEKIGLTDTLGKEIRKKNRDNWGQVLTSDDAPPWLRRTGIRGGSARTRRRSGWWTAPPGTGRTTTWGRGEGESERDQMRVLQSAFFFFLSLSPPHPVAALATPCPALAAALRKAAEANMVGRRRGKRYTNPTGPRSTSPSSLASSQSQWLCFSWLSSPGAHSESLSPAAAPSSKSLGCQLERQILAKKLFHFFF